MARAIWRFILKNRVVKQKYFLRSHHFWLSVFPEQAFVCYNVVSNFVTRRNNLLPPCSFARNILALLCPSGTTAIVTMQLRPLLAKQFSDIDPRRLPGGFDRVGDIAIISLVPEATPHARAIGELLLAHHPSLKVIARRTGDYTGEFRTRPLAVVAGEDRLQTLHRENGVVLHLDLARVYYSVRSAHERARIAALVRSGERVGVLCSGIGPFPLVIARHSAAATVIGIEKNPVAHGYALKNLQANRALRRICFVHGDVATVPRSNQDLTASWWYYPMEVTPCSPSPCAPCAPAACFTSTTCRPRAVTVPRRPKSSQQPHGRGCVSNNSRWSSAATADQACTGSVATPSLIPHCRTRQP
jgi:hypothetical protein